MKREACDTMARPKPEVVVVRVNGKTRILGIGPAADWLGYATSTVRNVARGRGVVMGFSADTIARIEREYPQIKGAL